LQKFLYLLIEPKKALTYFQVFKSTPLTFAFVNIKPLLPGHVLVSPRRLTKRLTDLTVAEVHDLFETVREVEIMLSHIYFPAAHVLECSAWPAQSKEAGGDGEGKNGGGSGSGGDERGRYEGSFNIAIQDGPEAGQSVHHVHVHVIPRLKGDGIGDEIYEDMDGEKGNVGGGLWDRDREQAAKWRPVSAKRFSKVDDEDRRPRSKEEMAAEAAFFKRKMEELESGGKI
jgi:bis(5'-adenosyl)-triphosphatase